MKIHSFNITDNRGTRTMSVLACSHEEAKRKLKRIVKGKNIKISGGE